MSSIEQLWDRAEADGPGGAVRIDEVHPSDLYAMTDHQGHRGLVLICAGEPPRSPSLDAVEVTSQLRNDGRWALGVWLVEAQLMPVFVSLCTDLIEVTRQASPATAAGLMLVRLMRWHELLETGAGSMGMSKLRGLVGELLVLEKCLILWSPDEVVTGWTGPMGGPQDFVLPGRRVEVKTTFASARSVRINSVDQLDADEPLTLAVVTLTTLAGGAGLVPNELVARIEAAVLGVGLDTADAFRKRLDVAGYRRDPIYDVPMFRLDGIEFYDVHEGFPRIRRAQVGVGIERVGYDVLLGACTPFRSTLAR